MKKITVVGSGYVGLANATMLAKNNEVTILDIDGDRVEKINNRISPLIDANIIDSFEKDKLNLVATTDKRKAYANPDWVIIATPTDYCTETNYFNTRTVEDCIAEAMWNHVDWDNSETHIVIKSTIPIGFVDSLKNDRIFFSPEFLREGTALRDCLRPERIVVGNQDHAGVDWVELMYDSIIQNFPMPPVIYCGNREAESVKLFANGYLAMRVAFFNELDTFAEFHKLNTKEIIEGVVGDSRIGKHYCNPSFGYGGYCFPKDTKQLLANYKENRIPNRLIGSVVYSNDVRMDHIANQVLRNNPKIVGIHRLIMKSGSDNFRSSAIQGIIERLVPHCKVIIHEPEFGFEGEFMNCVVESDLNKFKKLSDVIVTNRMEKCLNDVKDKVYTRDVFGDN